MTRTFAILGYNTINVGDDIQSLVTSSLLKISYIVMRDDYDQIYNFETGEKINILPEKIYLIMNGWFMHNPDWSTGNDNIKFPIQNNNIIPIYISCCLSVDVPLLFNEECIVHYKKHAPIFCRDSKTLELLKNNGVEAHFFGCITQLLEQSFIPDNEVYKQTYKNSVILIDCPKRIRSSIPKNLKIFEFNHYNDHLIKMNVKSRLNYALDLLSKYKYASKIYTGRLHAFLPCRAMGLEVKYVGDMNYRVKDLVSVVPDKTKLKNTFMDFVYG